MVIVFFFAIHVLELSLLFFGLSVMMAPLTGRGPVTVSTTWDQLLPAKLSLQF